MKNKIFGFCSLLSAILLLTATFAMSAVPASAQYDDSMIPSPPAVDMTQVSALYFYNITTDTVLVSENINERLNTSTSAKIMTGLIACEKLSGRLDERVIITEQMIAGAGGRSFKLSAGDEVSVRDLLYAAICGTYNDAAYALACIVGGSIDGFVTLMNRRAGELGAVDTSYINPIGYPDNDSMYTTALDVSKIALAAYKNELYMEISSAFRYNVIGTEAKVVSPVFNSNFLVCSNSTDRYYSTAYSGINSGFTGDDGGWCTVSVADDEGAKYLYVALGCKEGSDGTIYSYSIANKLVKWASSTYGYVNIFEKGKEIGMTSISNTAFKVDNAAYLTEESLSAYIPVGIDFGERLRYEVSLDKETLKAPVEAGSVVGSIRIILEDRVVGSCNLVLKDSYESNIIMTFMNGLEDYFFSRAFIATLIFIVIVLPTVIMIVRTKSTGFTSKMKQKRRY